MANLKTNLTGITFDNPFIVASSPSTVNAKMIKKALRAGWGSVVLKTIGLEPTPNTCPRMHVVREEGDIHGMINIELITDLTLTQWLDEIKSIRDEFPDKPLIASVMGGGKPEEWQSVVYALENAGVNAFEANVSCPNFSHGGRGSQLGQDPEALQLAVSWVRQATTKPLWVKLTPNVADITQLAQAAREAGADLIVATNTFSGIGGVDLDTFAPLPNVGGIGIFGGYSGPGLKPISMRCVASIARSMQVPIVGCGGISTWRDAAEYIALGASMVEVASAVMWHGYDIIAKLTDGLNNYLDSHGMKSLAELKGRTLPHLCQYPDLDMKIRLCSSINNEDCIGCGLCVITCDSGGFEAIYMKDGLAVIDENKCDGCGLCVGICPTGAISMKAKALA